MKFIHVVVGVIAKGRKVLIAKRPYHVDQGGLWEFPGGKVKPGELAENALKRELKEELGIAISSYHPFLNTRHHYEDKSVLLDIWWVDVFRGRPKPIASQEVKWVEMFNLDVYEFPKANESIIRALTCCDVA